MKPLLIVTFLALPLPALAETREERVAVATEYVDLALQGFDMDAVIETMYQPVLQQVAAGGQTLSDAQVARIRQLYLDTFTKPLTSLMREQSQIMADLMTLWSEGKIRPRVSRTFPLHKAHEAIQALGDRSAMGKIVVTVGP